VAIYVVKIQLVSDATFGRGDGIAGLVDNEVEHDRHGFPFLRGRTLKGLLSEACDNVIAVLGQPTTWRAARQRVFGIGGSSDASGALWNFGDARLPDMLRQAVAVQLRADPPELSPQEVLDSLTTIRRQTAIDASTGTPSHGSLRASRVILRDLVFLSRLHTSSQYQQDRQLLAAGCLALRHVGLGRNRGRGQVACWLQDAQEQDLTEQAFRAFAQAIGG